ncbi:MAG: SCO family protein [Cellvibrionaceae bacterium]
MTEQAFDIESRKPAIHRTVTVLVLIVLGVMFLAYNKYTKPRVLSEAELQDRGALLFERSRVVQPFEMLDKNGKAVGNSFLEGRWTIMFFGFTQCPDVCPTTLATLNKIYDKLSPIEQRNFQVVLLSLDPLRDTPDKLQPYMDYFNSEFQALTATDENTIARVARNFNIAHMKQTLGDSYTIDHSSHLALINPRGHYQGLIKPPFDIQKTVEVLRSIQHL